MKENLETIKEESTNNILNESILDSIKKLLNISKDDTAFDTDIIININSVFTTLRQLGVGPEKGFRILSNEEKWNNFVSDELMLDSVKTYVYLKVKLVFDPPLNSSLMDSFERQIKELEWRLNVEVESNLNGGESNE